MDDRKMIDWSFLIHIKFTFLSHKLYLNISKKMFQIFLQIILFFQYLFKINELFKICFKITYKKKFITKQ